MKKILLTGIISTMLLATLLAGCTGAIASAEDSSGSRISELSIGSTTEIPDGKAWGTAAMTICKQAMVSPGLVRVKPDGTFTGVLAESWETADNQKWTFHLVKNATFHDGIPVTSNDVKFTLEYLPKNSVGYKSYWQSVDKVETPDNYTIVINLKKPFSNFLTNLITMYVLPEHIWKNVDSPKDFDGPIIGWGPYKFVKFDKDAGVTTFKANDNYIGGNPAIETILYKNYKTEDALVMALEKGDIDTMYFYNGGGISYYQMPKMLKDKSIGLYIAKDKGIAAPLWFNTTLAPCNDRMFREALSHAINYDEILTLFAAGYGKKANAGFVPEGTKNYIETKPLTYDVNLTKQLLSGAGYKDVDGDGYVEYPDGKKLELTLCANGGIARDVRLSEMLIKYFKDAGVNVVPKIVDATTFSKIRAWQHMELYSMSWWAASSWGGYATAWMDPRSFLFANITDPKFTGIVDNLMTASGPEKEKQFAADVQNYYAENCPAIALYWDDFIIPYNKKYEGYELSPFYGVLSYETLFNLHAA